MLEISLPWRITKKAETKNYPSKRNYMNKVTEHVNVIHYFKIVREQYVYVWSSTKKV